VKRKIMERIKPKVALPLIIGLITLLLNPKGYVFSIFALILGLGIVFVSSEEMVEGLKGFSTSTGFSEHVTGMISSIASNLPEAVLALFMAFSPHLREVAFLTVMLASAFNGLLLGILVIMLTYKGGRIEMPREALEHDVEIMRITIAFCCIIFGTGLILNVFHGKPYLTSYVPIFLLLAYISYLYFVVKGQRKKGLKAKSKKWVYPLLIGLVGILMSAELISASTEFFVESLDLHVVIAATLIGFAGSVPEHGLAILGGHRGHVELGVSNLISGIVQSIMLVFPILALIVPVHLDGYILYQFLAVATTLWIVKKAIIDDHMLTLDEGVSIFLVHLMGIVLFDELSWLI
jgi:Ca2+/Na+ antiporter